MEINKELTFEEYIGKGNKVSGEIVYPKAYIVKKAIEFTKLKVIEALKKASEKVILIPIIVDECHDHTPYMGACGNCGSYHNRKIKIGDKIDKESILNAYDLDNIK